MSDTARTILLGILLLGLAGTTTELFLLAHYEDFNQWIPIVLNIAAIVMSLAVSLRPSPGAIRVFRVLMLLMIVSGAVGMYLHFNANTEFQLEMDPALGGWALFRKSIVAKAPPALAPGSMAQLGLIGLAYTFRHPALGSRSET